MKSKSYRPRVGELRPSQLLSSFGVGATIDLPHLSTLVLGLDDWDTSYALRAEIGEERLLAAVRAIPGLHRVERLLPPPVAPDADPAAPWAAGVPVGVPVVSFPRWLVCPACELLAPLQSGLFELRGNRPDRMRYVHPGCSRRKEPDVVPARFLVACERGHLDDFPWDHYVHQGAAGCRPLLRLQQRGLSGEAADIYVHCATCGKSRPMSSAFGQEGREVLPACRARRPHLRDQEEEGCPEVLRAILLGASNSWFSLILSALAIPTASGALAQLVEAHWAILTKVTAPDILRAFREIGALPAFASSTTDTEIMAAIEARRQPVTGAGSAPNNLKAPEWAVLSRPRPELNSDDFRLVPVAPPERYSDLLSQVVLVERLREVRALVGFTRIESPGDFDDYEELPQERRAPLARKPPTWVPATEVRGEGIFLQFDERAIQRWESSAQAHAWEGQFRQANRQWRRQRRITPLDQGFAGLRYVLLHSLSHALMRELALACGYTSASLQERIYALTPAAEHGPMAGLLIYTAAADSEGTLGGLVSLGQPATLGRHLDAAVEAARLCASDPLCAEHQPVREGVTLHGAACHACMFIPETACERGNKFLDRSVLVETVVSGDRAFCPPAVGGG